VKEISEGLGHFIQLFARWQELAGAVIGGLLGVIGTLIVAREVRNRERRNASRMLQHDLPSVTDTVSCLT
jgi:pilus assembly protein TadC